MEEGACQTNKKRKLDKYLSKYNYKGDKNEGIIEVDDETYHISRNKNKTLSYVGSKIGKNFIDLDKNFEKLKNTKRRDATLQHEIGHLKLHHLNNDNIINGRMISKHFHNIQPEKYTDNQHEPITKKEISRDNNIKKFIKYTDKNVKHAHPVEYEADAYAKSHVGGNHMNKAIREGSKFYKKDYKQELNHFHKLSNGDKDKLYHKNNLETEIDIQKRSKASKDKSIDLSAYK